MRQVENKFSSLLFEELLVESNAKIIDKLTKQYKNDSSHPSTFGDILKYLYTEFNDKVFTKKDIKTLPTALEGLKPVDIASYAPIRLTSWKLTVGDAKNGYRLTDLGIDVAKEIGATSTTASTEENSEGKGLAQGVDISKLKKKVFRVPVVSNSSKYVTQLTSILTHMSGFADGDSKTTMMLAGDVGSGKTNFVKSLADICGLPLLTIEAPHISQEHIINIPFLVLKKNKEFAGNATLDADMEVVRAESNIITQLKQLEQYTPEEKEQVLNKNPLLKKISQIDVVDFCIKEIAGQFKCILFIDEYYRTASVKIRNVLRNILNGKIGCWDYDQFVEIESTNEDFMIFLKAKCEAN